VVVGLYELPAAQNPSEPSREYEPDEISTVLCRSGGGWEEQLFLLVNQMAFYCQPTKGWLLGSSFAT
jgi:hypothetical protein